MIIALLILIIGCNGSRLIAEYRFIYDHAGYVDSYGSHKTIIYGTNGWAIVMHGTFNITACTGDSVVVRLMKYEEDQIFVKVCK